jgi:hypothetical protein
MSGIHRTMGVVLRNKFDVVCFLYCNLFDLTTIASVRLSVTVFGVDSWFD